MTVTGIVVLLTEFSYPLPLSRTFGKCGKYVTFFNGVTVTLYTVFFSSLILTGALYISTVVTTFSAFFFFFDHLKDCFFGAYLYILKIIYQLVSS